MLMLHKNKNLLILALSNKLWLYREQSDRSERSLSRALAVMLSSQNVSPKNLQKNNDLRTFFHNEII